MFPIKILFTLCILLVNPPNYLQNVCFDIASPLHNALTPTLAEVALKDGALITDYLPMRYVKDGSKDYTEYIQKAISLNRKIIFPSFPLLINETGLNIPSDTKIVFLAGSKILMKPTPNDGYAMLLMRNASNVMLINPVLVGDKHTHLGTTGDYGMGISIYGGKNITILNPRCREMWGDGIYLGVGNNEIPKNITIKNAVIEDARRNGISIIAVDGLNLESPYVACTSGTKPMAGIDIEPNKKTHEVKNVIINNPITVENGGAGIVVDFGNLMGGGQKRVSVTVNNHLDTKSRIGLKAMSRIQDGSGSTIQGYLRFVNPTWRMNSYKAIATILYGVEDVHVQIENPTIHDMDNKKLSKTETLRYIQTHINAKAWLKVNFK